MQQTQSNKLVIQLDNRMVPLRPVANIHRAANVAIANYIFCEFQLLF